MNKNFNKILSEAIKAYDMEKYGCEYCKKTENNKILISGTFCSIAIWKSEYTDTWGLFCDTGDTYGNKKINYCPMCGRKL